MIALIAWALCAFVVVMTYAFGAIALGATVYAMTGLEYLSTGAFIVSLGVAAFSVLHATFAQK